MEQKRTLWIVASVGIFLLVVLGGMLIFYKPQAQSAQTVAQAAAAQTQSGGWINSPVDSGNGASLQQTNAAQTESAVGQENEINNSADESQGAQAAAQTVATQTQGAAQTVASQTQGDVPPSVASVNDMTVYSQNTTIYGAAAGGANGESAAGGTVIDLNVTRGAAETNVAGETTSQTAGTQAAASTQSAAVTRISAAQTTGASASAASATTAASASATRTASASAATSTTTAASAPAVTRTTQYWVQAASFTNKSGADSARGTLDANKIPADVFTYRDASGNVFYRVRVGPYTTKSEAEYWQTRVAQISDFQTTESYVTQTTTVN